MNSPLAVFIAQNQQQLGPFSIEEVQDGLAQGKFAPTDLGWHAPLTNWVPLGQIAPGWSGGPAPVNAPQSWLAIVSLIIGSGGAVAWLVLVASAAVLVAKKVPEESPAMIIVGLLMFLGIGINMAGIIMGLVAASRNVSNKWMGWAGAALSGLEIAAVVLLMVLGTVVK